MKDSRHIKRFNEESENSNPQEQGFMSKTNKPQMVFNFRISNDSSGSQRFTEEEIKNEIKNDNVKIEKGLLIRKADGKVIGQFLI